MNEAHINDSRTFVYMIRERKLDRLAALMREDKAFLDAVSDLYDYFTDSEPSDEGE